ncbi:hypothetical protein GCM10012285_24100 [Streptomyces kronopolitis]|uniref:Uncharacterized protein n=1 Tax=Streptomyces kronopolitis TaxID=1612435 RepID=A0ABQ2JDI0_9ACTN|nr:hypothetical protein GCM10012285_24100 [Streptomyces kronopolitis]
MAAGDSTRHGCKSADSIGGVIPETLPPRRFVALSLIVPDLRQDQRFGAADTCEPFDEEAGREAQAMEEVCEFRWDKVHCRGDAMLRDIGKSGYLNQDLPKVGRAWSRYYLALSWTERHTASIPSGR